MRPARIRSTARRLIAAIALVAPSTARVATAEGPVTLATLIESVQKNEALYADIDVTLRTHYGIGDRKPGTPSDPNMSITVSSETETHDVRQGGLFRLEITGEDVGDDGRKSSRDLTRAFDGETTRQYSQHALGHLIEGRSEHHDFIRPHMLPLRMIHAAVPLSTYLSGHEAMKAHPGGNLEPSITMDNSYEGVAEYRGMKCHRVWITEQSSGVPHNRWELWLAEGRNYLPVRMLAYTFRFSDKVPVGEGSLDDLREIKPGVWFPFRAKETAYNKLAIRAGRGKELQWERREETTKVSLEPKYAPAYFRSVDFPDGTKMYEVEDEVIRKSYIKGDPARVDPR